MPRPKMKPRKCSNCPFRGRLVRGVCEKCYQAAKSRIRRGVTTDEQLVQLGWWEPAGRKGGIGESMKALDRLLATKAG